jgi:hypothetical protein
VIVKANGLDGIGICEVIDNLLVQLAVQFHPIPGGKYLASITPWTMTIAVGIVFYENRFRRFYLSRPIPIRAEETATNAIERGNVPAVHSVAEFTIALSEPYLGEITFVKVTEDVSLIIVKTTANNCTIRQDGHLLSLKDGRAIGSQLSDPQ